jgi:hypothetical protein
MKLLLKPSVTFGAVKFEKTPRLLNGLYFSLEPMCTDLRLNEIEIQYSETT